ncbi:MAG: VOC family protein [Bdellovibrionaceae bacterium]|nr:VOC family protein [Pseudobdellovibrionaceae bacterium]
MDQARDFLERAFAEFERKAFSIEDHWHIDHLCYRTSTQELYLSTKKKFASFAELLVESEVNGRLISTFKLTSPLVFREWEIDLIEVPAPKKGKIVADGFEHLEIVCDLPFDQIKSRYPQCRFEESGLSKGFNQELEIPFGGFAVKFHHLSLESVIALEVNERIFTAVNESGVLEFLRPFSPLIAGTFPLGLDVAGSDVDVLISGDLRLAKDILLERSGGFREFNIQEMMVQGVPTLFASFSSGGADFEIFGQETPSVNQRGYRHFLIEERLLKMGGTTFRRKVREAREVGLKTEPAFAKVLGLKGDPYEELLVLQKRSNQELKNHLASCGK